MATLVGKVGIVAKGAYNSASTYEALDAVSYLGSLYIAKQNVPANTAPTNTTYWMSAVDVSEKSDKTETVFKQQETVAANTTKTVTVNDSTAAALVIVGNANRTQDQSAVAVCTFNGNPIVLKSSDYVTFADNSSHEISVASLANTTMTVFYN